MALFTRMRAVLGLAIVTMSLSLVAVDYAEARRGGSFGSRGARTFQAPPVTNTMPRQVAPVDRTMTQRTGQEQTSAVRAPAAGPQTGGLFGGFGRSMIGGLLVGGLIGMMLGTGFGGAAGLLGMLLQVGLLVVGGIFLMRWLRRRQEAQGPAYAGGPGAYQRDSFRVPDIGARGTNAGGASAPSVLEATDEIGIGAKDFDAFEQMLTEVQEAYGREDFAALRERTTPEVMSYLSEELSQNATRGLKNEVSDVKLLQGDLAESWREGDMDYATVAIRYESRDVTRERATGRVVEGDADQPTETTELWTFKRTAGAGWKLSAIQAA
jgi:predicted lipid-binding transport protein (Tim44 family)